MICTREPWTYLSLPACVKLESPEYVYETKLNKMEGIRTYALGHHLRTIVRVLKHRRTNDLDATYVG